MVGLGFEPGTAERWSRTNPLGYGGPHKSTFFIRLRVCKRKITPKWWLNTQTNDINVISTLNVKQLVR